MAFKKKLMIGLASIMMILPLGFGASQSAQAKYAGPHAFPTEFRGKWYMNIKEKSKFTSIPVRYSKTILYVGKVPFISTTHNICDQGGLPHITKHLKSKTGFSGNVYSMTKGPLIGQDLMWVSHHHSHGHRVLMSASIVLTKHHKYYVAFSELTKNKTKQKFEHIYHGSYKHIQKMIGR